MKLVSWLFRALSITCSILSSIMPILAKPHIDRTTLLQSSYLTDCKIDVSKKLLRGYICGYISSITLAVFIRELDAMLNNTSAKIFIVEESKGYPSYCNFWLLSLIRGRFCFYFDSWAFVSLTNSDFSFSLIF